MIRQLNVGNNLDFSQRGDRELALYALDQLATLNSDPAVQALRKWAPQLGEEMSRAAWARLATAGARRHEAVALAWFQQAGIASVNDFQREWWVRAALRAGDWPAVRQVIESMGDASRALPVWRYWHARPLQAAGQRVAANAIFLLSRELHYYGQLAQEELGPVAQAPVINMKMGGDDVAAVARLPGIARALALYELGLRSDASQEWNWSIRGFSDAQLLAAAEVNHTERKAPDSILDSPETPQTH